nr:protease I [Rarobacter faecitabidus, Peptide Partial, 34 aa] [Rarobacter faecitabidus]
RDYWGGDALSGTLAFPVYGGFLTAGHAVEGKGHI